MGRQYTQLNPIYHLDRKRLCLKILINKNARAKVVKHRRDGFLYKSRSLPQTEADWCVCVVDWAEVKGRVLIRTHNLVVRGGRGGVKERDSTVCWWLIQTQGWPHVQTNTLPPLQSQTPHGRHSGMITLTLPPSVHCGMTAGCTTERGKRMRGKTEGSPFLALHTSANEREFNFVFLPFLPTAVTDF